MGAFNFNKKNTEVQPPKQQTNKQEMQEKITEYNDKFDEVYNGFSFDALDLKEFSVEWWETALKESEAVSGVDKKMLGVLKNYVKLFVNDINKLKLIDFNETMNNLYFISNDRLRKLIQENDKSPDYIKGAAHCIDTMFSMQ